MGIFTSFLRASSDVEERLAPTLTLKEEVEWTNYSISYSVVESFHSDVIDCEQIYVSAETKAEAVKIAADVLHKACSDYAVHVCLTLGSRSLTVIAKPYNEARYYMYRTDSSVRSEFLDECVTNSLAVVTAYLDFFVPTKKQISASHSWWLHDSSCIFKWWTNRRA